LGQQLKRVWTLKQWLFQDVPNLDAIAVFIDSPHGGGDSPDDVGPARLRATFAVTGGRIMLGDV
jgi:hypothetical protein